MNFATMIFPGNHLPYHVVDYAINWAKENEGRLVVLFLLSDHVPAEGYPFPNDLDEAEELATDVDAQRGVKQILNKEIRYIEKRANASHIPVKCEVLQSPRLEQIVARVNQSDIIFIDKNMEDHPEWLDGLSFRLSELREKTTRHLFEVGEFDRYSDVFY